MLGQITPSELRISPAPPMDVAQSSTRPRYRSARKPNTSETATTTTIASGMLAAPGESTAQSRAPISAPVITPTKNAANLKTRVTSIQPITAAAERDQQRGADIGVEHIGEHPAQPEPGRQNRHMPHLPTPRKQSTTPTAESPSPTRRPPR